MTRRNPPAKWVLPEAVNPPGRRCFVINVPDEPQHIAAFRGAMLDLASAYKWADDVTHMARDVALVWRDVIDAMEECPVPIMLRTNPFDSCGAQVSFDGGVVWTEFFNARQCATDTVRDTVGNQTPPGGSSPVPAQCFDLDFVIQANSMKVIPLAVASGWTLAITQKSGAWWDGDVSHYWQCIDGHQFALGTCTSNQLGGLSADPIPTSNHMRLILQLADGTFAAIPIDGTTYTVPSGQPVGNYFLLANDSLLSDNQGSVSLHLHACNAGWCYEFNALTGLDTWIPGLESSLGAIGTHWSAADGAWLSDCYQVGSDWYGAAQVHMTLPAGTYTRVQVDYLGQVGTYSFGNGNTYIYDNGSYLQAGPMLTPPATYTADGLSITGGNNFAVSVGYSNSAGSNANCASGNSKIRAIRLYGTGTNPFGSNNC